MITIKDLYIKKKIPEISKLNLEVADNEAYVILSPDETAFNHLSNIFSGLEKDFKGIVAIGDFNLQTQWEQCEPAITHLKIGKEWPQDMKIGNVVDFFKKKYRVPDDLFEELYIKLNMDNIFHLKWSQVEAPVRRKLLFELACFKKSENYILRDFARDMPLDFKLELKNKLLELKSKGHSILYMSDDVFFAPEIGDRIGFMKKGKLLLELKAATMKKMSLKELYFQFLGDH
jgi:ABC-type Na+ transport system ATPase subunit NatA